MQWQLAVACVAAGLGVAGMVAAGMWFVLASPAAQFGLFSFGLCAAGSVYGRRHGGSNGAPLGRTLLQRKETRCETGSWRLFCF